MEDDKKIQVMTDELSADELREIARQELNDLVVPPVSEGALEEVRRETGRWVGDVTDTYIRKELEGVMDNVEAAFVEESPGYKKIRGFGISDAPDGSWRAWDGVLPEDVGVLWFCWRRGRCPPLSRQLGGYHGDHVVEVLLTGSITTSLIVRRVPSHLLYSARIPIPVQPLRDYVRPDGTGRIDVVIPDLSLRATFNYRLP